MQGSVFIMSENGVEFGTLETSTVSWLTHLPQQCLTFEYISWHFKDVSASYRNSVISRESWCR
jgi:hypothetical protein